MSHVGSAISDFAFGSVSFHSTYSDLDLVLTTVVRANIGNAKIEGLEATLGMKGNDYNVALMVFFVPYVLFGKLLFFLFYIL